MKAKDENTWRELDTQLRIATLTKLRKHLQESIDEEIGDLATEFIAELVTNAVAHAIHNRTLAQARAWFASRVEDLEVDFAQLERQAPADLVR